MTWVDSNIFRRWVNSAEVAMLQANKGNVISKFHKTSLEIRNLVGDLFHKNLSPKTTIKSKISGYEMIWTFFHFSIHGESTPIFRSWPTIWRSSIDCHLGAPNNKGSRRWYTPNQPVKCRFFSLPKTGPFGFLVQIQVESHYWYYCIWIYIINM